MGQVPSLESGANRWGQVRLLPEGTAVTTLSGRSGRPDSDCLNVDGIRYGRVLETGFTMLIAWIAGPEQLVRLADSDSRASADQDVINEAVREYLASAGLPSPPESYRWYQHIPRARNSLDDVYALINGALREVDSGNTATHPGKLASLLTRIVAGIY